MLKDTTQDTTATKWDVAIDDAERRLVALKQEVAALKRAIRVFTERKKAGAEWPVGR